MSTIDNLGFIKKGNRVITLFGPTHKALCATYPSVRDSYNWDYYWNNDVKRFVKKTGTVTVNGVRKRAKELYAKAYTSGSLVVPAGRYFSMESERLIRVRKLLKDESVDDRRILTKNRGNLSVEYSVWRAVDDNKMKTSYMTLDDGTVVRRTQKELIRGTYSVNKLKLQGINLNEGDFIYCGSAKFEQLKNISAINEPQGSMFWLRVESAAVLQTPDIVLRPEDIKRGAYSVPQIIASPYTKVKFEIEDGVLKVLADAPMCTEDDCVYRVVITHYEKAFEKDGKTLTMEYMRKFVNSEDRKLSLKELIPFLKHHRLPFTALDGNENITFEYKPEDDGKKRNKHISNCHLFIMAVNDHVYDLNNNSWAIERTEFSASGKKVQPPSPFITRPEPIDVGIVCNDETELHKAMADATEKTIVSYTGSIEEAFLNLREKHSYVPEVFTKYKSIRGMVVYNGDNKVTIRQAEPNIVDALPWTNRFNNVMFKGTFKSYYSQNLKTLFSQYRKAQLVRRFQHDTPENAYCVDARRHYTWAGCQFTKVPVFIWTDDFKKYDGHDIEDYTIYMVGNYSNDVEHWLIADRKCSPVSGYVLNRCGLRFSIESYCRPSSLVDNPFPRLVKELYESNACDDTKKFVPLHTIGRLGKTRDNKEKTVFTTSLNDALNLTDIDNISLSQKLNGYFATQVSETVVYDSGFYPFQFMVYDIARLKMLEMYKSLVAAGKHVYGILSDALYCDNVDGVVDCNGKTYSDLGKTHVDGIKKVPQVKFQVCDNEYMLTTNDAVFTEVMEKPACGNVLIVATDAGAGKTYTSFLGLPKDQVLAVAPGNKQVNGLKAKYGCEAITVCKFLGERVVDGADETKHVRKTVMVGGKALKDFKYIVFDEFFQNPITECSKLLKVAATLDAQIICNGDVFQNSNRETCTVSRAEYFESVLPRFFPYRITLSGCRRLKLAEDRETVSKLRADLHSGMRISEAVVKYKLNTLASVFELSECIRKNGIKINITLENGTASVINQMYTDCVRPGDEVVCKKYFKTLVRNVTYTVEDVTDSQYKIEGKLYPKSGFRLPYAYTCHSVQGEDVDEAFVIYDTDHINANNNWFYTAVTRATYLSNVFVYTGPSLGGAIDWSAKLRGYREQDQKAGRENDLTVGYVKELCSKANYCCCHCKNMVHMVYEEESDEQWTLDRKDDTLGHLVGNVQLSCLGCNRATGYLAKKVK